MWTVTGSASDTVYYQDNCHKISYFYLVSIDNISRGNKKPRQWWHKQFGTQGNKQPRRYPRKQFGARNTNNKGAEPFRHCRQRTG
jgi:hypothetical protein